jgi:hypothetical protein
MRAALAMLLFYKAIPGFPQDCRAILGHQAPDVASLRQVEEKWNDAFVHGHTDYLECLLASQYLSVSPKGTHDRKWELEHARQNHGSTAPIPETPGMIFDVHGNTGVMRILKPASPDGKHPGDYLADIFAFQDGAWRAVYSQHIYVEAGSSPTT